MTTASIREIQPEMQPLCRGAIAKTPADLSPADGVCLAAQLLATREGGALSGERPSTVCPLDESGCPNLTNPDRTVVISYD